MNHRTQNHSDALKATPNLYQANTAVHSQTHFTTANLADCSDEIQMVHTTFLQLPSSEQINDILEADLADHRVEIQRDDKLKFTLQEWETTLQNALITIQYKRADRFNAKNELYQLIAFYTVSQGVVLTAVAQGRLLKCQTCWGPTSLSSLASIATIPAVHDRLKAYNVLKNNLCWEIED